MFDEVDEGTQYFKINNNPPFFSNALNFSDYGNNPEDHYLWLAGEATRSLQGEFTMESTFRTRADNTDFQSGIEVVDNGSTYEVRLSTRYLDGRCSTPIRTPCRTVHPPLERSGTLTSSTSINRYTGNLQRRATGTVPTLYRGR